MKIKILAKLHICCIKYFKWLICLKEIVIFLSLKGISILIVYFFFPFLAPSSNSWLNILFAGLSDVNILDMTGPLRALYEWMFASFSSTLSLKTGGHFMKTFSNLQ